VIAPAAGEKASPHEKRDPAGSNATLLFADSLHHWWSQGLDETASKAARALLLDGLAVAALGSRERGPQILAQVAIETGSAPVATLIGHTTRVSAPDAARANGAAMHVLDYEPMWNPANHALSTTLPAVLAVAEILARQHGRGQARPPRASDLLTALAIGIEAQARLRLSSGQFEPAGLQFHPPGAVGPIGSAVACGLLLGLDSIGLAHAIGIAASRAGGILANVGSMTKALHCGGAAAAGLEAAILSARGFTADADALSGARGFGRAFFGEGFAPEWLTKPMDRLHVVEPGPAFKFYPSQYGTHFVITAALNARKLLPPNASIRQIRIISPPMPYVHRAAPATGLAGKFSFQYTAAVAVLDGTVTVGSFTDERRFAPDLDDLLDRTEIHVDPMREGRFDRMRLDVEIELDDNQIASGFCDGPPGIWGRPAESERLAVKAQDCLIAVLPPEQTETIIWMANRFDELSLEDAMFMLDTLAHATGTKG
jgi:aconitate decarboxylase